MCPQASGTESYFACDPIFVNSGLLHIGIPARPRPTFRVANVVTGLPCLVTLLTYSHNSPLTLTTPLSRIEVEIGDLPLLDSGIRTGEELRHPGVICGTSK